MQVIWASLIAVIGTLGGALTTGIIQQRSSSRSEYSALKQQSREYRLNAYIAFTEAIAQLRGDQVNRWTTRHDDDVPPETYQAARTASHRARVAARSALFRVNILASDAALFRSGHQALDTTIAMLDADNEHDLRERAELSRTATEAFIARAAIVEKGQR